MAIAPIFATTPNTQASQVSTPNLLRDGTGVLVTVFTAGATGSIIEKIIVRSASNTTAGMIRFFYNDGVNSRLIQEVPVTAITVSGTVEAFSAVVTNLEELVLVTGHSIQASTNNAEITNILVHGTDF